MKQYIYLLLLPLLICCETTKSVKSQDGKAMNKSEIRTKDLGVGFYNLENLFDTINDPETQDDDFTPQGDNQYTEEVYQEKLQNLSRVISELGVHSRSEGLAVLGVAEVENKSVLHDLVSQPTLRKRNYQIVHYDSPYYRGMDVAFLYNPAWFHLEGSKVYPMSFVNKGDTSHTRDILYVVGKLDGERMHFLINHWPSRSGGEKRSAHKRNEGAAICRTIYDSLRREDPDVGVIVMGDFNDNPVSPSLRDYLKAEGEPDDVESSDFYNPMWKLFRKGIGSNAWRDTWSLFDQIVLSSSLTENYCDESTYCFRTARIYNAQYLTQNSGQFAGYPHRSYAGSQYIGGYSDHFSVYVYLRKNGSNK